VAKKLKKKGEMVPGAVVPGGSMASLHTGSWRTYAPKTNFEKCTHCLLCWIYCPDSAIEVKGGKKFGTDFQYCKGCGICAKECPVDAIEIQLESEMTNREKEDEQPRERKD
jgi:pyruvate ferredoxin oxidoreductase delta subunit